MSDAPIDHFACPSCARRYRWTERLAGRAVRCPDCGIQMRVPGQPGSRPAPPPDEQPDTSDGPYELDDPEAPDPPAAPAPSSAQAKPPGRATLGESRAAAQGRCPGCNAKLKPGAVVCLNCGYHLRQGRKVTTTLLAADAPPTPGATPESTSGAITDPTPRRASAPRRDLRALSGRRGVDQEALTAQAHQSHMWQTWYLPALLVAGGLALLAINVVGLSPIAQHVTPYLHGTPVSAMVYSLYILAYALIRLVIQVPVLMGGLLLLVYLLGASFGPLGQAMLKLLAIALVTGSVNDSLWLGLSIATGGFAFAGSLLQWSIATATFWGLCVCLLDLDILEMFLLYAFTIVAPVVILFFLAGVILAII